MAAPLWFRPQRAGEQDHDGRPALHGRGSDAARLSVLHQATIVFKDEAGDLGSDSLHDEGSHATWKVFASAGSASSGSQFAASPERDGRPRLSIGSAGPGQHEELGSEPGSAANPVGGRYRTRAAAPVN